MTGAQQHQQQPPQNGMSATNKGREHDTQSQVGDLEIIAEVLQGNVNRYAVLIQRYNQRLYRICKGYLREEAEIEDLMQDTYVKAFTNLAQFGGQASFSTWITRILINEALQRTRKLKVRAAISRPAPLSAEMNYSDQSNPETSSMNKELQNIIEQNVDRLPVNYRVVFLMREVEKMNVAETADALSLSESNVKVRLNRAKEMLRSSLMKSYPLEELYEFNLVRCARIAERVMAQIAAVMLN